MVGQTWTVVFRGWLAHLCHVATCDKRFSERGDGTVPVCLGERTLPSQKPSVNSTI
eukprot:COSAG06_NODE_584_length_14005_cov_23.423486_4_plen_56_part_00